ncbi:Sugar kinase of the NBD/HSP70 family, may contain an N-terminal HTH domain [Kaistia soli DSM 19436]|uniref:Sugar kinase of the NBD/HSP70 family, may contain an N-terminal HTH domain n=1 Tax=Kaistia soli DSM 19436 TaxID=1122133 RepID=A0A1M5GVA8_9HYPH|nr:ROK family protein [Kaistia soli]SHG07627.1 Sugar kinase of the NBD/HSP70 family, may contain an N-terminal HTH domain [Kaistia soli DSM 19436]
MQSKADTELVRRQNRGLVLEALRRVGMMARVELGRATGLSPATISAITGDLLAENLIVTAAIDDKAEKPLGRGRPRVALSLNPEAGYVLGVKISLNSVTLILSDYSGHLVDRTRLPIPTMGADAPQFVPRLAAAIRNYLRQRDVPLGQVPEIPIAIPGVVDRTTGRLVWSPTVSVDVGAVPGPLSESLGVPVSMTNDVDMMAQALNSRDPVHYGGTFAIIFIAYGIGMGLYVNGRLFSGAFGSGAEFGHTNHVPGGPLCRCGRRGCVEAYVADYAIYRSIERLPPDEPPADIDPDAETMAKLEARARAGDDRARTAYHQAGLALGYGLSRLMGLINPGRVVLTGRGIAAFDLMQQGFRTGIQEGLVTEIADMTEIEVLSPEDDLVDVGILAGALQRLDREVFASSDHEPVPPRRRPALPAVGMAAKA